MAGKQTEVYFFKAADIVLNVVPGVLRAEFKARWDKKYPSIPWDDGKDACIQHLRAEEKTNKRKWSNTFKKLNKETSDRNTWDTQLLTKLLLSSVSTGTDKVADPQTYNHLDTLRESRNAIAHSTKTAMSKADFDTLFKDIETSVAGLNYPGTVKDIRVIRDSKTLPSAQQIDAIKNYLGLQKDNRQLIMALFVGLLSVATVVGSMLVTREDESEETKVLIERYIEKANNNRALIMGLLVVVLIFAYIVLFPSTNKTDRGTASGYFPESKLPSHFRGRREEISEVINSLTAPPHRLYNLYGSPAFGKTSTSIAVGKHFRDKLGYRVAFVELKGKVAISDIGAQVLKALGIENLDEFTHGAFLERLHKEVTQKTLLILDNVEDVLLTVNKDEFKELLRDYILTVNSISIMSTSRVMFNLLGVDMKNRKLDKLPEENCVEILQALNPSIKEDHAKQFAEFTGGIPLLLELIGSQLESRISEAEELIQAIEESNVIVASEDTEHIERSKNLYKMIELLFGRINPRLRREFLALSVFPASFSKTTAKGVLEKVFGASYDNADLAELEHASFLMRYASAPGKRDRLDMHPVLKEFAQLVAKRDETKTNEYQSLLQNSELSFHQFFIYVLQMMSQLFGSRESKKAMEQYDEESVNIRKVLTQAVNHTVLYPSYTNVLFEASDLLLYRVPEYELSRIFKDAADKAHRDGAKDLEIALLALEGDRGDVYFYHNKDKYGLTQKLVDMEMDLIEQNYTCDPKADINMTALSYFVLGRAHALYPSRKDWDKSGRALKLADPNKGIKMVQQAIELYETGKNPRGKAMAYSFLGLLYKNWKRYDDAVASYHQALQIYETMYGDHVSTAATLYNIGYMYSKQSAMEAQKTAMEYYDRSYKVFNKILKDHRRTANSAANAGEAMYNQGMYEECLEPLYTARRIYEKVVSLPHEERPLADTIQQIAEAKFELGDYKAALSTSQDSLAIRLKEGVMSHIYHRDTGFNHRFIANCYRTLGNTPKAIEHYQQSVEVFRGAWEETHKCRDNIPDAEMLLADYYRELGNVSEAVKHYRLAEQGYQDMDNANGAANAAKKADETQNSNPQ